VSECYDRPNAMATDRPTPRRAPLGAVLTLSFVNSLGTGVVTNGIFFLAVHAYGFGKASNFALAILQNAVYVVAALAVAPALTRLAARFSWISTRSVLFASLVVAAIPCFVPILLTDPSEAEASSWTLWTLVGVYGLATGALWPITESFLSGGRRGTALRSAVGRFNITWAVALVVAFWTMAPLVESGPLLVLASLGFVHLLSALALVWFGAEPGRHLEDEHEPHPDSYRALLALHRVLLPGSYILLGALSPILPSVLSSLEIRVEWQTPVAATWLASRTVVFAIMERWHGWHGSWSMPALAGGAMLVGFASCVLAPQTGPEVGRVLIVLGLALFGVGAGAIYAAALYYALEVGNAEVAAGGMHEALIGIGYATGPICGLAAIGAIASGVIPDGGFSGVFLTLIGAICVVVALLGWRLARRALGGGRA